MDQDREREEAALEKGERLRQMMVDHEAGNFSTNKPFTDRQAARDQERAERAERHRSRSQDRDR